MSARAKTKDHSERGPVIWARERERRWKDCVHPFEDGEPVGYIGWHGWAETHMKTHVHTACPDCGLFVVCSPKKSRRAVSEEEPQPASPVSGDIGERTT